MELTFKLIDFAVPFAYAAGIYKAFSWLDEKASEETKIALLSFLNLKDYDKQQVSSSIVAIFDIVYSQPLFSVRSFSRSAIVTILITALYIYEVEGVLSSFNNNQVNSLLWFYGPSVAINILSDYASLFLIRYWLSVASRQPIIALLTCIIWGLLVVIVGALIRDKLIQVSYTIVPFPFDTLKLVLEYSLLYPAMLVFAWLPLFGLCLLGIRLLNLLARMIGRVQGLLKGGQDHPLVAVGCLAALIVFLGTWVLRYFLGT